MQNDKYVISLTQKTAIYFIIRDAEFSCLK